MVACDTEIKPVGSIKLKTYQGHTGTPLHENDCASEKSSFTITTYGGTIRTSDDRPICRYFYMGEVGPPKKRDLGIPYKISVAKKCVSKPPKSIKQHLLSFCRFKGVRPFTNRAW